MEALRAGLTATPSPSSSVSEGLDMFPESPQIHHGIPHPMNAHYQLQQLSPGDFRPRASSNASSISRLSPIPAMPETEAQESPWSPADYPSGGERYSNKNNLITSEHFNPDQLVDNITENMKIGDNRMMSALSTSPSVGGATTSCMANDRQPSCILSATGVSSSYSMSHTPLYSYTLPQNHPEPDFCELLGSPSATSTAVKRDGPVILSRAAQLQRAQGGPSDSCVSALSYSMSSLQVVTFKHLKRCIVSDILK